MPLPGRLNITIYQGDDFDRDFLIEEIVDGQQVPVNFTGHEVKALVKTHQSSPRVIGVFDIQWPYDGEDFDMSQGIFNASLDSETTSRLPRTCVYDIQSINITTGKTKTWVYGKIRVIRQVTSVR